MSNAPAHIWRLPLECGFDVLGDLARFGIPLDDAGVPDLEVAREAWAKFGPAIMKDRHPRLPPPWGQLRFGWIDPSERP